MILVDTNLLLYAYNSGATKPQAAARWLALAIEFGATLCTTDRDFRRFDGLKLLNPIGPS